MVLQKKWVSVLIAFLFTTVAVYAQSKLPRSNPEAEGVSSDSIIKFIDAAGNSQHEMHSIMIVRHGKVIAEGWSAGPRDSRGFGSRDDRPSPRQAGGMSSEKGPGVELR